MLVAFEAVLKCCLLMVLSQGSNQSFTDLLNLNMPPSTGPSLLVDVFSENSALMSADVSEENFLRLEQSVS